MDEASIALWMHYRREPEQFAQLPEAWRHSIAGHYADALKRQRLRQRRSSLPLSVLAALAAVAASKAKAATSYTATLTGTVADTSYQSGTDANGNLVYRLAGGDGIGVTGAQDVSGVSLQSGTPKVVLQVDADGKGALSIAATRPQQGSYGTANAIDVQAGGDLTVNGRASLSAQANDAVYWVVDHNEGGSGAQGLNLIQGKATFNGDLSMDVTSPAYSHGMWIYQGDLTVNGRTTIVARGRGANTAGLYNSGGGRGNVVFNGDLDVTGYGIWPSDNVHGIYNDGINTRLTVNGDMTVAATSNGSTVMGIRNQGNFYVSGNATVTADGPRSAFGVDNTHRTARFHVGGDLKVTVANHGGYTPFGQPTALSSMYGMASSMTLDGAVNASVSGVTESYAINNNSVMSFTSAGKTTTLRASVDCAACDVYGIANSGGSVVLAGGLDVAVSNTGSGARHALWNVATDGQDALLSVNQAGGQSVKVDGDVVTRSLTNAVGTSYTGTTRLNVADASSFLKGMVLGGTGSAGTSTYRAGTPVLSFAHGARWMPTGTGALVADFGSGSLTLGTGSAIDMAANWGAFAPGSVPAHDFRQLHIDSSTGGATVNLADGATFTLLSDIRNGRADTVSFGSGIAAFAASGTQHVRIAYDPVLDDTSWVSAAALRDGVSFTAAQPIAIVDAGAAAGGAATFKAAAGVVGQWGATYENALVRFNYVPRVQASGDGKQILLTGIDIPGSGAGTSGGASTPPATGGTGTGGSGSGAASGDTPVPSAPADPSTSPVVTAPSVPPASPAGPTAAVPPAGAMAIAPSTGVLVAGDAALALANLWQIDERAVSRRSESLRAGEAAGTAFWVDAGDGGLRGDAGEGRAYRQSVSSASAGAEWRTDDGPGRSAVGLVYTRAKSRADLRDGTADLRGDSVGIYGTWQADNGLFADAVARAGRLSDRYTARDALGVSSGRYHARAASLSVRAGQRFGVGESAYIEPQVQAAYGSIGPSSYVASSRVHVEVERSRTFQSRAGVLAGQVFTLSPAIVGDAYARVALVHTIGSRPSITASLDGGSLPVFLPRRHATTGEAAMGVRVAFSDSWGAFVEAGRTSRADEVAGGWRAAAGVRLGF